MTQVEAVVFDFGGVLIDWDPRYVFRKVFNGDEAKVEWFLQNICNHEWNIQMDAGKTFADGVCELQQKFPEYSKEIAIYHEKWEDMLGEPIAGTVAILKELKNKKIPLWGLTNWSAETFPVALKRFDFLALFDGILVSGEEKLAKPDKKIFELLISRYQLNPQKTIFIDDNLANVEAAKKCGLLAEQFVGAEVFRKSLVEAGLL